MTPGPDTDFAQSCAELCPGFRADAAPRRARKSELLAGTLDGAPVIAKRLLRPTPVWEWYFAREVAIYRELERHPPGVRVPRFVHAERGVLVIERLPGPPLATRRRPHAELATATVARLVAIHETLVAWRGRVPAIELPARVRSQLRDRLLEDPTSPHDWVVNGIERSAGRRAISRDRAASLVDAIRAHAPVAFGHGDMLLRNAVADGDDIGLVDWECAGDYIRDWDLALLWTQLATTSRAPIDEAIGGGARLAAFRALCGFALLRELRFARAFSARPDRISQIRAELAEIIC